MNGLLTMTCNSTKVARGTEVKLEGEEFLIIKESEILAILP